MYKTKDGLIFRTKPWKHQLAALRYLMKPEHSSAALLLQMGAGKTKIWIDLINNMNFGCTLIVCPYKAARVWVNQIPVHTSEQSILVVNLVGMTSDMKIDSIKKNTQIHQNFGRRVVFIINYDSVWREPLRTYMKNKVTFDAIICDESHRIKSPSSKVSKFMQILGRRCEHRYIATGTLMAQTPLDVYAQYRFLKPEVFGTNYGDFCRRYTNIDINRTMRLGYTVLDSKEPYVNLDELNKKIMSCAFSVDAELDLPPTHDIVVEFDISSMAENMYKDIKKDGAIELSNGTMEISNVLSMVLRLQQITSGFIQLEDEYGNRKTEVIDDSRSKALEELLTDLPEDEPVVIFARFNHDIKNIHSVCSRMGRRCSEISGRCDEFDEWNKGKTSILVVQIQSGAEGLDFTRAKYAIYYSLTYALYQYNQSRKRLHRPGQEHPVTYYLLMGKLKHGKSIDESIFESLQRNENFIHQIMSRKCI